MASDSFFLRPILIRSLVITALRLEDDPELLEIEDKIRQYRREENEKRKAKEQADAEGKSE